jgi:hypothetical protein
MPGRLELERAVESASSVILAGGFPEVWVEGAIYPTELAFFFGCCEVAGVRTIIESGRQDGYSTRVVAELAMRSEMRVVSIDYEEDKARAQRCRDSLVKYDIDLVAGNAFEMVGRELSSRQEPVALLIDGPKHWGAISLMFAAAQWPNVHVLALHNMAEQHSTRAFFERIAQDDIGYEGVLGDLQSPAWRELLAREAAHSRKVNAVRTGLPSTLGVIRLNDENRARVAGAQTSRFRTYPPRVMRWAWRSGNYGTLTSLIKWTNRIGGPEKYLS